MKRINIRIDQALMLEKTEKLSKHSKPKVLIGDLFKSPAQTIVNTVNCVGIMGKGIALEYKRRFPEMFVDYEMRCERKEVHLGKPYLYKNLFSPHILNFPTKDHWRGKTNLKHLISGLEFLIANYKEWGIESIAVPPLGCGNGQLEWRVVGPTLFRYFSQMEIPVEIFAPYDTPHDELNLDFLAPALSQTSTAAPDPEWIIPGWVVLAGIVSEILNLKDETAITSSTFKHIAICLQTNGIPLDISVTKSPKGPSVSGIKNVIKRLSLNGIIEEVVPNRDAGLKIGPTFNDALKAFADRTSKHSDLSKRISEAYAGFSNSDARLASLVIVESGSSDESTSSVAKHTLLEKVLIWARNSDRRLTETEVKLILDRLAKFDLIKNT